MKSLEIYLEKMRQNRFDKSPQLSLGEIIKKLDECGTTYGDKSEPKTVCYDFGTAIPTTLGSWRGSYSELALGYKLTGYDDDSEHFAQTTVESLLNELNSAIGKTFYGWKGGEFQMNENTPVWVANSGNSGNTGIVDVVDDGWRVILMTAYCEF